MPSGLLARNTTRCVRVVLCGMVQNRGGYVSLKHFCLPLWAFVYTFSALNVR